MQRLPFGVAEQLRRLWLVGHEPCPPFFGGQRLVRCRLVSLIRLDQHPSSGGG